MAEAEIVREWIEKADEDFEFASVNLDEGKPFHAQICYHFGQATEKYLKAFIVARKLEFRKTHDLPLLLKTCISEDPAFDNLKEDCEYLTTFYIETRYPVHWPTDFSASEAQKSLQSARKVQSFVKERLQL